MKSVFSKNKELTFTKNFPLILASTKLNAIEKLIIARVLNWQSNDLKCNLSNAMLAQELGISVSQIKRVVTNLNKLPFFNSQETSRFNEYGKWINSKEMVIDEIKLFDFVNQDLKPNAETKPIPMPEIETPIIESEPEQEPNEPVNENFTGESGNLLETESEPKQDIEEPFSIDDDCDDDTNETEEQEQTFFELNNGTKVIVPIEYQDRWHLVSPEFKKECADNKNQYFFDFFLSNEENEINAIATTK